MRLKKWGNASKDLDFSSVESALGKAFQPITPRPQFVRRLRREIANQYYAVQEQVIAEKQRQTLLIGAGLVGGIMGIVVGIRITITLIAAVVLLFQLKKPSPLGLLVPSRVKK